ncbi:MAG: hypothetical protein GTO12_04810 [Proteobacteria bacterium]|nr:hypothetical protein [Pseudomonadota bacterium]
MMGISNWLFVKRDLLAVVRDRLLVMGDPLSGGVSDSGMRISDGGLVDTLITDDR